jgi:hypothetical protein
MNKNTELTSGGRDLMELGAAIRHGQLAIEEATRRVGEIVVAQGWADATATLIQGMGADARDSLRECLDADALGEAAVAGGAAFAIIELREDLARLLIGLRVRPDVPALEGALGQLEEDTVYVIRWLDGQVARTELPERLPRLLAGVSVPEDLVALAWRLPERWWLGWLLVPPLDGLSSLLLAEAAKDGIRLKGKG